MAESDDQLLRELGERKLVEIEIRGYTRKLNDAVLAFNQQQGRFPQSLEELAGANIIPVPVNDALGGTFFLGDDGVIRNTTLLDEEKKEGLKKLQNVLKRYEEQHGTWPPDLQTLVDEEFLPALPKQPYPGASWHYDPATGHIE
jgi:hypothetical protein